MPDGPKFSDLEENFDPLNLSISSENGELDIFEYIIKWKRVWKSFGPPDWSTISEDHGFGPYRYMIWWEIGISISLQLINGKWEQKGYYRFSPIIWEEVLADW